MWTDNFKSSFNFRIQKKPCFILLLNANEYFILRVNFFILYTIYFFSYWTNTISAINSAIYIWFYFGCFILMTTRYVGISVSYLGHFFTDPDPVPNREDTDLDSEFRSSTTKKSKYFDLFSFDIWKKYVEFWKTITFFMWFSTILN